MRLGIKEIQEIIPHRHPFLLIDFIDELEPGKRAVGYKSITFNEPQFNGHFPGQPVMPGVLMIEALAQVGAVAILSLEENKGKTAFFGAINNAKFKQMVPVSYTHLIIGADCLSKLTDWSDRGTCVLFGDGAGAAVIRAEKTGVIHSVMGLSLIHI